MKKHISIIAGTLMVFGTAATAMAYDNYSDTTQSSNWNNAAVIQDDVNNTSLINQTGNENATATVNDASVNQTGNGANFSVINQTNAAGATDADKNTATVAQANNACDTNNSEIEQNGVKNTATVLQNTAGAQSGIHQGSSADAVTANTATVNQYSAAFSSINQTNGATENSATVLQTETAAGADSTVNQSNTVTNTASVTQHTAATAAISQSDSAGRNAATIEQDNGALGAAATINQLEVSGYGTYANAENQATIYQNASGVTATIDQNTAIKDTANIAQNAGSDGSVATILQNDSWEGNSADITQNNGAARASIVQTNISDLNNSAKITQNAAATATILQDYAQNGNTSEILQNAVASADITQKNGQTNTARITQSINATNSNASILQEGSLNKADILQDAQDALADIDQHGDSNTVQGINGDVTATVNGFTSVYQNGTDNMLNINQCAGSEAHVSSDGNNNLVTISQSAGSHFASVQQQHGSSNIATVTQGN